MTTNRLPSEEGLVEIDGSGFYAVPRIDRMQPFLMSVVSDGDRWMFVSSGGALTAGRGSAAGALFPYLPDDRLHDLAGRIGPVTAIRVASSDRPLWTPFRGASPLPRRSLAKSVVGDSVIFEELHPHLPLRFRYRWSSCEQFGFVRTVTLANDGDEDHRLELVDGVLDVLPAGLSPALYQRMSNLTNAYKRNEVIERDARLAVFSLESRIVDQAEPAEELRATVAWSTGLDDARVAVSPAMLTGFEAGGTPRDIRLSTGERGAYLLGAALELGAGEQVSWQLVADVGQDQVAVTRLEQFLAATAEKAMQVEASIEHSSRSMVEIMARADALQRTGDRVATAHHFANVTYNVMRGGIPLGGYRIDTRDLASFLDARNRHVRARHGALIEALPAEIDRATLLEMIDSTGDTQLKRLCLDYLPFSFSRRHGDPSRPWNTFEIRVRDETGSPILFYEGNWRDIFQNWEALSASFPEWLPSVVSVFLNASTADGFNPYRITREGIDWEVPDPEDPWSNIGYWGDHQIVYLLRLLEALERHAPGHVAESLAEQRFSYADVPYRLHDYDSLVRDPKNTIDYDEEAAERTASRVGQVGGDGRLVWVDGEVYLVTLAEKLLVPALAKLSSFVPGGGIWMNTQRPEWNDANNALVGFGLSMVTLFQLRRYLHHLRSLLAGAELEGVEMSAEVADWLATVASAFTTAAPGAGAVTARDRRLLMDELGRAFARYRSKMYSSGFSGNSWVPLADVTRLCNIALEHLDDTIARARRPDGLYHSYNLVRFSTDGSRAEVEPLQEMLEGQVAAVDSGALTPDACADVVDALFASAMYREDQRSFTLYPNRALSSFLDKNVLDPGRVEENPLLGGLIEAEDRSLIVVDAEGRFRFAPDLTNRNDVESALDTLAESSRWGELASAQRESVVQLYEDVFHHHTFTGRSGSMYGYEGLGSIYWHMVAKLLVAIQDAVIDASSEADPAASRLVEAYWRVRTGLGFNKSAREFGAIPIDPYSHTPAHAGAQQPGMTGLVKEELLTRPLELGFRISGGEIHIDPILLREEEFLDDPASWRVYDVDMRPSDVWLEKGSLGLTICQVPIVLAAGGEEPRIRVTLADGSTRTYQSTTIDRTTSSGIFGRTGEIERIDVLVPLEAIARRPS